MTLPRYPAYKDSGVEWLGEVPGHWNVFKLKRCVSLLTEKTNRRCNPIGLENIEGWSGRFVPSESDFQGEGVAFERGDVLFGKLRPYLAKAMVADKPGEAVGDFHVMRPHSETGGEFLAYQIRTQQFVSIVDGSTYGAKMPRVSWEFMGGMPLTLPPGEEQALIAAFLDHETSKIDALIAEQNNLIALLKEKRQAVISHAVTKGLNPDVPMKDTGVEWLGEVPEHWRLGPLKYFVLSTPGAIKTGPFGSQLTSAEMVGGPFKVFTQRQIIDNDFAGEKFISEEKFSRLSSFQAFPGDLLVTTRGTIGRAAILPLDSGEGVLHPCVLRVQADRDTLDTHYLWRLVQDSHLLKTQIELMSNATTIEVIYSETMANLLVPVPPKEEQVKINAFLDGLVDEFDLLISQAGLATGLLQERRSALISAAVTGKIDVRNLAQKEAA